MAQAAAQQITAPEYILVKWATPTEEAISTVRLAAAYCTRRIAAPENICIVVPNRMWAANINRAAKSLAIPVSLCIPQPETPKITQALDALSQYESEGLCGLSLLHRAGLNAIPELGHALLHVQGTETADELRTLIRTQLKNPTVPRLCTHIPVVLLGQKYAPFDYLFVVGCVEGLVSPVTAPDATQNKAAETAARKTFIEAIERAHKRATISYFVKAPADLAEKLNLQVGRYKTEHGTKMAMVGPSRFITEKGSMRPTTTGGQTLLRAYGLN